VNYIVTAQAVKPTKSIAMTVNVTTTGNPTFDYHTASNNICSTPSTVRIYFQRQGDDLSGTAGSTEYYRWWSTIAFYTLAPGKVTITGDLTDLSSWTDVLGHAASTNVSMFQAALANIADLGMTFGGGCFNGHGVFVDPGSGSATFNVESYVVE